jgi:hypothetical protein
MLTVTGRGIPHTGRAGTFNKEQRVVILFPSTPEKLPRFCY